MSSVRLVTLLTRTPEGRSTLNSVTVGPSTQPTTLAMTPKSSKVPCSSAATSRSSSSVEPRRAPPVARRFMGGSWKPSLEIGWAGASFFFLGAVFLLTGFVFAASRSATSASCRRRPSLRVMGAAGSTAEMSSTSATSRGSGAWMGTRPSVFWAPSCRVTAASDTVSAAAPRERRRGCSPKEMRAVGAPWAAGGRSADSAMVVSGGLPLPRLIDPKASGMREAAPSPSKS